MFTLRTAAQECVSDNCLFFHGRAKESCNNIYHTEPWSACTTTNATKITGFQEGATVGLGRGLKLRCAFYRQFLKHFLVNYQKLDGTFFKTFKIIILCLTNNVTQQNR